MVIEDIKIMESYEYFHICRISCSIGFCNGTLAPSSGNAQTFEGVIPQSFGTALMGSGNIHQLATQSSPTHRIFNVTSQSRTEGLSRRLDHRAFHSQRPDNDTPDYRISPNVLHLFIATTVAAHYSSRCNYSRNVNVPDDCITSC